MNIVKKCGNNKRRQGKVTSNMLKKVEKYLFIDKSMKCMLTLMYYVPI